MRPVHDVLVHLGATLHIVRLDRQHFLQGVGCSVGLQRPDFHFPESLPTKLGFTAQWLLRHQTVRPSRTRVHLVIDKMIQLQHVHVANSNRSIEWLSGTPVDQCCLAGLGKPRQFKHVLDLGLSGTVEYGCRYRHTVAQVVGQL